jgi:GTP-binding protein HflX
LFFDRPDQGERAVLVQIRMGRAIATEPGGEFRELVKAAGAIPVAEILGSRDKPHPGTFVGEGKVAEIAAAVQSESAEVVVFDHDLSPSQERNLERELKCRVLNRTRLILDIFAQRARTMKASCRSNWRSLNTCRPGWCVAGLIWSASGVESG